MIRPSRVVLLVVVALPSACNSQSSGGGPTTTDAGEPTGTGGGTLAAGGSAGTAGSSGTAGTLGDGGVGATSGHSGSGGAAARSLDGGHSSAIGDAGSTCLPGGPCKLSAGPCHVGTVFCDSVGIGWCRDDGFVADGTHCGTHGTCNAGACVETTPCNVSYNCSAGQTCWTKDGAWFDCMTAGSGVDGDSCNPSVFATVTCGDGLACLGAVNVPGHCVAWCNSTSCPSDKTCTTLTTAEHATVQFCL